MKLLTHFTSCENVSVDDRFGRICKVRYILSSDFDADIETKLNIFFDKNCSPRLSDKEYYYRHDAPLGVNALVLVPARNTLTVAVVTQVNLENITFSTTMFSAVRTMKKVIGVLALSPVLCKLAKARRCTTAGHQDKLRKLEGKIASAEIETAIRGQQVASKTAEAEVALANLDAATAAFERQAKVTQSLKDRLDNLKKGIKY